MSLNHIVKERYPSFVDAVRDLDDPLCLFNLFASLPSHRLFKIPPDRIIKSQKLTREFNYYVMNAACLKKVFLSIKGIYFQAEIEGQSVVWLQPYQFSQNLPYDVDYRVMLTFLEFYETMLKFILFKLYSSISIQYPPNVLKKVVEEQDFSYNSLFSDELKTDKEEQLNKDKYQIDNEFHENEDVKKILEKNGSGNKVLKGIFDGLVFFLSTEVPRTAFEFMVISFGGKVISDLDNFESEAYKNSAITHVVTDRPPQSLKLDARREFVQPQWVCDSINNSLLLPLKEYAPGKPLPPHLSPFGETGDMTYIPDREKQLQKMKGEEVEESEVEESSSEEEDGAAAGDKIGVADDSDEESYLEDEQEFDAEKEETKALKKVTKDEKERKELGAKMLTKRKRRILDKIKFGQGKKAELAKKLKERRKEVEKSKKNQK